MQFFYHFDKPTKLELIMQHLIFFMSLLNIVNIQIKTKTKYVTNLNINSNFSMSINPF